MGMERQGDEDEARRGSKAERSRGGGAWHRDLARRLLDAGSSGCRLNHAGGGAATCAGEDGEAGQQRDLTRLRRGKKTVGGGGA